MSISEENVVASQENQRAEKKDVPLYALMSGNIISYVGDTLTFLAVPWFVLQTTGSATQTAITAFFSAFPLVLSSLFGSIIVDRLGYKRTSVISDFTSGITVGLVPLLYHTVGLAFWALLGLVFIGGLLKAPGITARGSLVPDLATTAKMSLEHANAIADGLNGLSGFIGAPLAAVLITVIGASNLLWFDAISFFISALVISILVPFTPAIVASTDENPQTYLQHLREGVGYIFGSSFLLSGNRHRDCCTNLLDAGLASVVAPVYIKQIFNSPLPLELIFAAFGGAAFVGTLIFGTIGHRLPRRNGPLA